jgi:hypothetical protein
MTPQSASISGALWILGGAFWDPQIVSHIPCYALCVSHLDIVHCVSHYGAIVVSFSKAGLGNNSAQCCALGCRVGRG